MLYIGCQYQAIKKVKRKESRPTLPMLFTGRNRKHTYFFWSNVLLGIPGCIKYNGCEDRTRYTAPQT